MTTRRPVAIDLFSGAGGLSLGFEAAGFDVLAAVEYDAVHAATHKYNFPYCEMVVRDVTTVTGEELRASARTGWVNHHPDTEWDEVVDVVIGGPSCQGFSTMGKQDPLDERNKLVLEFVRLVEELRPRAFCMENVPGFLDPRFADVREPALSRLEAAGYHLSGHKKPLHAEDFGVPQKRRRVLITGSLDVVVPTPVATSTNPFTVADALAGLPADLSDAELRISGDLAPLIVRTEISNDYLSLISAFDSRYGDFGHRRIVDTTVVSGFLPTIHSATTRIRFAETPAGKKEPISRSYRLDDSKPSLTLRAGTGRERGAFSATRPIHPSQPRVITVREAARLHSFPDWFRFHSTNWHGHRQIGNSVPPLLAQAVAACVLGALELIASAPTEAVQLGEASLLSLSPTSAAAHFSSDPSQIPMRKRSVEDSPVAQSPLASIREA